jgi:hypothetical protein
LFHHTTNRIHNELIYGQSMSAGFDINRRVCYNYMEERRRGMEKFIPFEKLSKKKKRELMEKQRRSWGPLNPVTRKPDNPKAYKRAKEKARLRYDDRPPACL